jgi:hypothetical protein
MPSCVNWAVPTENLILHGLGIETSLIPLKIPCSVVLSSLIYLEVSLFGYLGNFSKRPMMTACYDEASGAGAIRFGRIPCIFPG